MRARLLALAVIPLLTLTACGGGDKSDSKSDKAFTELDGVSVSGKYGAEPTVKAAKAAFTDITVKTISEGKGPAASKDGNTITSIGVWSGVDGTALLPWSGDTPFVISSGTTLIAGLADMIDGVKQGSRIAFAIPVSKAVDPSVAQQLGLADTDDLVGVIDVNGTALTKPDGTPATPPAGTPKPVEADGKITSIDWTGVGDAPTTLQVIPLIQGTGAAVKADQKLVVNYFGEVYKGTAAFDESYSRGPTSFALTKGQLIDAWTEGLADVKVGSRVLIIAPADKGYGDTPPDGSNIPAGATLAFVVDILGAQD